MKGQTSYYIKQGSKYATKFNSSKSCAISVLDTSIKGKKNWVIRFDKPHLGKVPYDHININPKISGIKDPHIPLPPGGLAVIIALRFVLSWIQFLTFRQLKEHLNFLQLLIR